MPNFFYGTFQSWWLFFLSWRIFFSAKKSLDICGTIFQNSDIKVFRESCWKTIQGNKTKPIRLKNAKPFCRSFLIIKVLSLLSNYVLLISVLPYVLINLFLIFYIKGHNFSLCFKNKEVKSFLWISKIQIQIWTSQKCATPRCIPRCHTEGVTIPGPSLLGGSTVPGSHSVSLAGSSWHSRHLWTPGTWLKAFPSFKVHGRQFEN